MLHERCQSRTRPIEAELWSVDTVADVEVDAEDDQLGLDGPNLSRAEVANTIVADALEIVQQIEALAIEVGQGSQALQFTPLLVDLVVDGGAELRQGVDS